MVLILNTMHIPATYRQFAMLRTNGGDTLCFPTFSAQSMTSICSLAMLKLFVQLANHSTHMFSLQAALCVCWSYATQLSESQLHSK